MNRNILIVDDDPIFSLIVTKLVTKQDPQAQFYFSENGQQGLTELEKLKENQGEKIVLLDINMPISNGWDFLDALEQKEWFKRKDICIYIVSSSIDQRDISKVARYNYVNRFFHKPLKINDIRTILNC